ncbi:MAG: hypothetical protein IT458_09760 [Planctomycetes bacterium]|nr:hypothetical protein [Planctomycetota bacterium]
MSHEVHEVPPAPREVRWSAVLWLRWPLALLGFVLVVWFGLFTLMLHWAREGSSHRDELGIAADPGAATATIERVDSVPGTALGRRWDRVEYVFATPQHPQMRGHSFVEQGRHAPGSAATVEFRRGAPEHSRLLGARLNLLPDPAPWFFGLLVLPGVFVLLVWLLGVVEARRLLAEGDAAAVEIVTLRLLPGVVPGVLLVRYRFRDRRAVVRSAAAWVRARSALGQRLQDEPRHVVAIHDRGRPERSRLAIAGDFLPAPRTSLPRAGSRA